MYKFVQQTGKESWDIIRAQDEEDHISKHKPCFTTILAVDNTFRRDLTLEEKNKLKYFGPFYADFDAPDLELAITQVKKFVSAIKSDGVREEDIYVYATGGKGFHVIVPMGVFIDKPNSTGYTNLPAIYKEMAYNYMVDTLDLRVYSAGKGRQFRTENVERPDRKGVYKVRITHEELESMTLESYLKACSAPRPIVADDKPVLAPKMAIVFESCRDQVTSALASRKTNKIDKDLAKKFRTDMPNALKDLLDGVNITSEKGFNEVATQLAIMAVNIGWTLEAFLEKTKGLCQNHQSNSSRYDTPSKREQHLKAQFTYMQGNPCYQFSIGGLISLLEDKSKASDLMSDDAPKGESLLPSSEDEYGEQDYGPVQVTTQGMWVRTKDGVQRVSNVGLLNPVSMMDGEKGISIGYQVDVYVLGEFIGQKIISQDSFSTSHKLNGFCSENAKMSFTGSDTHARLIGDLFAQATRDLEAAVYSTTREGLDIVEIKMGSSDHMYIGRAWVTKDKVISTQGCPYKFKFSPTFRTDGLPEYDTDILSAPDLVDTPETRKYFEELFQVNQKPNVAKLFGYFTACHFCQLYRQKAVVGLFPQLQIEGQAGAGKTSMAALFSHLHIYKRSTQVYDAASIRNFGLENALVGLASLPLILEELKPREMTKRQIDSIHSAFRNNYNGNTRITKGSIMTASGASKLTQNAGYNRAPIVYLGEAPDMQTAILERCVMVSLSKHMQKSRKAHYDYAEEHKEVLSSLGRLLVEEALLVELEELKTVQERWEKKMLEDVGPQIATDYGRMIKNLSIVIGGLESAKKVLAKVFNDYFDTLVDELIYSLVSDPVAHIPKVVPEAIQVLNFLAFMSSRRIKGIDDAVLLSGEDYLIVGDRLHLDIRECYIKYAKFNRGLGDTPLYDNYNAFAHSLAQLEFVEDTNSLSSPLSIAPSLQIYELNIPRMLDAGVAGFKVV